MRCGQWDANRRTELYASFLQQLLQTRKPYVRAPISDVQRLLRLINMPTRCLLDRHVGVSRPRRKLSVAHDVPFHLVGILFEDKNIKKIETDEFAQLVSENSRQLLRFATSRECLRDAKQRVI